jgi:hypothetical protein
MMMKQTVSRKGAKTEKQKAQRIEFALCVLVSFSPLRLCVNCFSSRVPGLYLS